MTEEQKDILIEKMVDSPTTLTGDEVEAIMNDAELRDIYNVSVTITDAYLQKPEINVHREWSLFRSRMGRRTPATHKYRWIAAAAVITMLFAVGVWAFFALHRTGTQDSAPLLAHTEITPAVASDTDMQPPVENDSEAADYYDKSESIDLQAIMRMAEAVDIDEVMRLEEARIDNALALQTAEIYELEYSDLIALLEEAGDDDTELQKIYNQLTMQ